VPRVAGIEDPTTYLLTKNEENQKEVNGLPSKAHGSLPKPKFGSGACISSYTRDSHQWCSSKPATPRVRTVRIWLDRATIRFRFYQPSSFNTALRLVLRPHFLVHFV
jgi:hypothetical protein